MIYLDNKAIKPEGKTNSRVIIERATGYKRINMTDMRTAYNEREHRQEKITAQNLYGKMKRDTFTFTELSDLLDSIGFDLMIVPREETPDASPAPEEASEDKPLTVGEIKNYESVTISEKTAEDLENIATYTSYDLFMRGGIGVFEFPLDTEDGDKLDEEINTPMIDVQDLQRMLKIAFLYGMREGRK